MGQGLPPGAEPEPNGNQMLAAGVVVLAVVIVSVLLVLGLAYVGGWVAHVIADIAKSGWESK